MYPLKFEPLLKSVVWGGDKIVPYKGIESTAKNVGESWELSAVSSNESVVANGEFAGRNIVELIKEYKADLLGEKVYAESGDTFPILVKFIDARDDLSIQVHPDDELAAARHNGSKGKTEMWYVVKTDEGAHLMSGMSQKITPEEYVRRIEENTITDVLCDYKTSYTPELNKPVSLVECNYFKTHLLDLMETVEVPVKVNDSFMILICLEGAGALTDSNGYELDLKQGETVLVPAVTDGITFTPQHQLKILTCWI